MQFRRQPQGPKEVHFFNFTYAPLYDADSDICGIVCVGFDVTETHRVNEKLREADRRKDEFIATLAHELRNPLAPIRNALQIARSRNATDAQRIWGHEVIDRQVRNMALLLDDLLDVSRITRGTLQLRIERVALAAIIDTAVETARPLIDSVSTVSRSACRPSRCGCLRTRCVSRRQSPTCSPTPRSIRSLRV